VFWRRGYEDTSVADLTETMGINPPSLYAAFGNKEGLFRKAVERYEARRDKFFEEAFAAPSAREAMERLLKGTADRLSDKRNPTGCLMVQGALCGGEACESVKQDLATRRAAGEGAIRERLKRAKREGICRPTQTRLRWRAMSPPSCKACRCGQQGVPAARTCAPSSRRHSAPGRSSDLGHA
jgi:AcrR family transcriptional regulator